MLRRLLLATGSILAVAGAFAQIPALPGYHPGALPQNLPLPVAVSGEGISEQACPVVLYLPADGAAPIAGARPAAALPQLPATCAGYELMVLGQTLETPLTFKNGRIKNARIPLFAYCPIPGARTDPARLAALVELAAFSPESPAAPEARAQTLAGDALRRPAATPEPAARREVERGQTPAPVLAAPVPPAPSAAAAPGAKPPVEVPAASATGVSWETVGAEDPPSPVKDSISVGAVISDDRQWLRNRLPVHAEFLARPLSEVLLQLATAANIDFSIGVLPGGDPPITTRFTAAPFAALEEIAKQGGVGVYHEPGDPLWVIRKIDPETLIARTYQLHQIHLGSSAGAAGDRGFGTSFQDMQNGTSGSGGYNSSNSSSGNRGGSTTGSGAYSSSPINGLNGVNSPTGSTTASTASDSGLFAGRFDQPSDVLFTIRSILGLIEKAPMVSDLRPADDSNPAGARVSTRPSDNNNKVNGLVSYNAESNAIFVVGTEQQQQWVEEYLRTVDRPPAIIGIDALFVETDQNPAQHLGVNLTESLMNWHIGAGGTTTDSTGATTNTAVTFGTLGHLKWPSGAILSATSVGATINAMLSEADSRVARYPRVVTTNNREVRIATTTNIPIITNASTVVGATTAATTNANGDTTSSGTINTNYSSGTQEIGTIITLLPSRIDGDRIYLKISIEISSGENVGNGEKLTGRIPTTSTVYEGEVIVPADKTLAIGGLERIAETSNIQRVPGLSKIPLFGFLFKAKDTDFRNTNITLFITPRLIRSDDLPSTSQRQDGAAARALRQSANLERQSDRTLPEGPAR